MGETILTIPAADVGTLEVQRTDDGSETRFEIWQTGGMASKQIGWLLKDTKWRAYGMDETSIYAKGTSLALVLSTASHVYAERNRQARDAADAEHARRLSTR